MESKGFFNGDRLYGQEEFKKFFSNMCMNGICKESNEYKSFEVTGKDRTIKVETGYAIINGFYLYNKEIKEIGIEPVKENVRIDSIVIRLDLGSSNDISIVLKKGIESSIPEALPPERKDTVYELVLANIKIDKSGELTIIDERSNPKLCGYIVPQNGTIRNIFIQENQPLANERVSGAIWMKLE